MISELMCLLGKPIATWLATKFSKKHNRLEKPPDFQEVFLYSLTLVNAMRHINGFKMLVKERNRL